jgi:LPS export ABC transporter protein LptC
MMNLRSTLSLLICLCMMGLLGWYFGSSHESPRLDEATLANTPDLHLSEINMFEYDEDGKLAKHLVSDKMTHVPKDNQFFIHAPDIYFRVNEGGFWHLTADEAITQQGFEELIFKGHVMLAQPPSSTSQALTMQTTVLTYLPKKEQAFTNESVQFEQVGHVVHASGMQADLKTNHVRLHAAKAKLHPTHA